MKISSLDDLEGQYFATRTVLAASRLFYSDSWSFLFLQA